MRDRYYSFVEIFNYVDLKVYHRRIRRKLPRIRWLFQRAAKRYGFSWTLLAAVSYQESHWNPKAKSPTGVQGLMMLTRRTARELGVRNRLSPTQSVMGGARYLRKLKESIPSSIRTPDRMWFALAAYNMGMGHLRDARTLAKRLGKDPNLWRDVRAVLPLLARKKYFRKLKYGYARGTEAVRYVRRIRNYRDILDV